MINDSPKQKIQENSIEMSDGQQIVTASNFAQLYEQQSDSLKFYLKQKYLLYKLQYQLRQQQRMFSLWGGFPIHHFLIVLCYQYSRCHQNNLKLVQTQLFSSQFLRNIYFQQTNRFNLKKVAQKHFQKYKKSIQQYQQKEAMIKELLTIYKLNPPQLFHKFIKYFIKYLFTTKRFYSGLKNSIRQQFNVIIEQTSIKSFYKAFEGQKYEFLRNLNKKIILFAIQYIDLFILIVNIIVLNIQNVKKITQEPQENRYNFLQNFKKSHKLAKKTMRIDHYHNKSNNQLNASFTQLRQCFKGLISLKQKDKLNVIQIMKHNDIILQHNQIQELSNFFQNIIPYSQMQQIKLI